MYLAVAKPSNYLKPLSVHFQDWISGSWIAVSCASQATGTNQVSNFLLLFIREKQSAVMHSFSHQICLHFAYKKQDFHEILLP